MHYLLLGRIWYDLLLQRMIYYGEYGMYVLILGRIYDLLLGIIWYDLLLGRIWYV